jgi:hypothetical protein
MTQSSIDSLYGAIQQSRSRNALKRLYGLNYETEGLLRLSLTPSVLLATRPNFGPMAMADITDRMRRRGLAIDVEFSQLERIDRYFGKRICAPAMQLATIDFSKPWQSVPSGSKIGETIDVVASYFGVDVSMLTVGNIVDIGLDNIRKVIVGTPEGDPVRLLAERLDAWELVREPVPA